MGTPPPTKQTQKVSLEDTIIEMRLQAKQVQRASKKSQKQSQQYMKKAKQSLKKQNEQGAKMYLMSASNKRSQALNYQRTAAKMTFMCDRIKSNANNQKLVSTFGNMTNAISQQLGQLDTMSMATSMQQLNKKMDQMMINQKLMEQVMQQNDVVHSNTVDQMMNVLKQQLTMENNNNMNIAPGQHNLNINTNVQQKQSNNHDPFLDQLKGL